jgi:hypothetical protein
MTSLDNFDPWGQRRLDSPRSLQACARQGINPGDLLWKSDKFILQFYNDGLNDPASLRVKRQHFEELQDEKLILARQERQRIIQEASRPQKVAPPVLMAAPREGREEVVSYWQEERAKQEQIRIMRIRLEQEDKDRRTQEL